MDNMLQELDTACEQVGLRMNYNGNTNIQEQIELVKKYKYLWSRNQDRQRQSAMRNEKKE